VTHGRPRFKSKAFNYVPSVHDAFYYYYDNMDEVERDVAENEGETNRKSTTK